MKATIVQMKTWRTLRIVKVTWTVRGFALESFDLVEVQTIWTNPSTSQTMTSTFFSS
jgi:hypothetical protein